MGDTQKSQTISTENQGIAWQVAWDSSGCSNEGGKGKPPVLVGESSLVRIKMLADADPSMVFISLAHRIDLSLLRKSFRKLRKNESTGVDKVTAKRYAENLDENLNNLNQRLRRGQYVASPVKRVWLDKEDGKKRPVGITALEDKIVQKAVAILLGVVYEPIFHDFSHGYRPDHSQHKALSELREMCRKLNINWILSADISGLFDNIAHQLLREMIRLRVNDGGIIRLIGKWLNAGVAECGEVIYPEKRTPQGGVISPVLSNVFLHYVLDDWYVKEVQPRIKGKCFLIRFADDFIMGFQMESDAKRIMEVSPKRFNRFKLDLHPEKTRLIPFGKPSRGGKPKGTFDFLGQSRIDTYVFDHLRRMLRRRHPKKTVEWLIKNYWSAAGKDVFAVRAKTAKAGKKLYQVVRVSTIGIRRYVKIKAAANPYLPEDAGYFWRRRHRKESKLLPAMSAREYRAMASA